VAALSAAGVLVLPAFASAQTVDELVDQYSVVNVEILQEALSNSGLNEQSSGVFQGNDTVQLADSEANGGDADATSDSSVADALAGFGGASAAANAAESANDSSGGNSQTTGAAVAANAVSGTVSQSADNSPDNLAVGDGAEVLQAVIQTNEVNIGILQAADANSGANFQDNTTEQGNVTDQVAVSSANGGSASATSTDDEAISTAGDGGDSAAGNLAASSNTSSGGNSQTAGGATASNSSSFSSTQSSSNSSVNTADGG
jgi:hypothetical protein